MVDQWRHRSLWQRYWHWSPRTPVETGWSDSWGSNAEAWHDKSALYFRASGGKEKRPISMLTQTQTNPDNVAASALSHELHLKPLSLFCVVPRYQREFQIPFFVSLHILFPFLPINYCYPAFPVLAILWQFFVFCFVIFAAFWFSSVYICLSSSIWNPCLVQGC